MQVMASPNRRPGVVAKTVEIAWHSVECDGESTESKPIYAVAFHPNSYRFATIGYDKTLRIWELNTAAAASFLFTPGHKDMGKVASCIASEEFDNIGLSLSWSPCGRLIAVGLACGTVKVGWLEVGGAPAEGLTEKWIFRRTLCGHDSEVHDLAFSPDSSYILSVSHKGSVAIHAVASTAQGALFFEAEMHDCCRSCAWDPWGKLVATFGFPNGQRPASFILCKFIEKDSNKVLLAAQRSAIKGLHLTKDTNITATSSLRIAFSPDGMLIAAPNGKTTHEECKRGVYIYQRENNDRSTILPMVRLGMKEGGLSSPQGCVWAPGFFEPRLPTAEEAAKPTDDRLPWGPNTHYRMALAVWNADTVVVYTTDTAGRYAYFTDLHYRTITSVTWSPCARYLLVSSLDNYISVVHFATPIGNFHKDFNFVTEPSACSLLQKVFDAFKEKGTAIERQVSGVGTTEGAVNVIAMPKKKKIRPEAVPQPAATVADADELAALLDAPATETA